MLRGLKARDWFANFVAPLAILAGGGFVYFRLTAQEPPPPVATTEEIPLVETVPVQSHAGGLDLEVDGVVVPYRDIELAAEVSGRIVRKSPECRAGQFVTAGTTLYEIDPSDYELEVQRLRDQLAQAEANLAESAVELKNTAALIELSQEELELQRNELARVQRLSPRAISESEVDKAKKSEWTSRNNVLTLNNQLQLIRSRQEALLRAKDLVQTQLRKAQLDVERTKVRSPIDGIVIKDLVEQDSFVQKGAPLAIVEDTSKVEVRCSLQIDDLMWLWWQATSPGESANLVTAGAPAASATEPPAEMRRADWSPPLAVPSGTPATPATANLAPWPSSYELPRTPVTVMFQPQGTAARFYWEGTLSRYDGHGLDDRTRTIPTRVVVENPRQVRKETSSGATAAPPALVRGMFVTVLIHADPPTEFVLIPETAVQPGKKVYRVRNGKLEVVGPLTLAQSIERESHPAGKPSTAWIVHAGNGELRPGDRIVSSPLPAAYEGMPVKDRPQP